LGSRTSLVVLSLLVDEEPTTPVVDEGASQSRKVISFRWWGFLFTISSYAHIHKIGNKITNET
jgi:hypothetical protein